MPRRKLRTRIRQKYSGTVLAIFFAVAAISTVGPALLGVWIATPPEYQIAAILICALLAGFLLAMMILAAWYIRVEAQRRRHERERTWHRAMNEWQKGSSERIPFGRVKELTWSELEDFAEQVYRRLGYDAQRVGGSGDNGIDVRLVNPHGQVEIVQCKQWGETVGAQTVRDVAGAMIGANAVRCFLWAPSGFSKQAIEFVKGRKDIVLMDEFAIGRMVTIAYSNNEKRT